MKEIPLRERIVAALNREEYQRAEEILLSDWTLAAVHQREEERRRKAQAEPVPVALQPMEENQRGEAIPLSDWTLAAVKQREEDRRRHEREEKQRAKVTFVGHSLITFKQKEEERREKQKAGKQRAEEPPLIDPILAAMKQKEKEEERHKEELAAEAAVVPIKLSEIAEAKIVDEQAEAGRPAKDDWRGREDAQSVLPAQEDGGQRERKKTRAVPKSEIVRSGGTARMTRGILSTLTTVAISGAVGFGAGVYATPPDKADAFRAFVNSELEEINSLLHRERAAVEPKAKAPSQAAAPTAPEAAPKEIQSEVPAQPAAEAPAADAAGQKDMPDNSATPPSATPTENSDSQPTPAPSAEPVAPLTSATPATPTNAENVEQPKPVTKPHPKPPVKKPKPKPAEHHPKAAPAEQAPAAEEPAQ
ncbi:MAG: hypothetical protein WA733_23540 [Methylocystis sp.]